MDIFRRLVKTHTRGSSAASRRQYPSSDAEDSQIHFPKQPLSGTTAVPPAARNSFIDLPPELVYIIFEHANLPTALALGLCSHSLYQIATSVLNKTVIITQQNAPLFLCRAERRDPFNNAVQRVQVGRIDRVGHAERWNLSEIAQSILASFSALQEVEICGGTYVQGWRGLDEIGLAIGDRVVSLILKLIPPHELSDKPVVFSKARRLKITFMTRWPKAPATNIQRQLRSRFPNLRHLAVSQEGDVGMDVSALFARFFTTEAVIFSSLSSFEFILDTNVFSHMQFSDSTAFIRFLLHHAPTLRSLALPDIYPLPEGPIDLSSIQLSHLSCSIPFAGILSNGGNIPTCSVEELELGYLSFVIPAGPELFTNAISSYSSTRVLTLRLKYDDLGQWFRTIPAVLPDLTTLHLNFVDITHDLVNPASWERILPGFLDEANNLKRVTIEISNFNAIVGRVEGKTEYKVIRDAGKPQLELVNMVATRPPTRPSPSSGRSGGKSYWSHNF